MPAQPLIQSPGWIKAPDLQAVIETDRYVFATRRRAFLGLAPGTVGPFDYGVTSVQCSPQSAGSLTLAVYGFYCNVTLTVAGVGSVTVSIGGGGFAEGTVTGLTPGAWHDIGIATDGGTVVILEVYETTLVAADL